MEEERKKKQYEEFKRELLKQISNVSKFFEPAEVLILYDFSATIKWNDFGVD